MEAEKDESLQIKNGDRNTFDKFFTRNYPEVRKYVYFIVNDNDAADDVTQESFMKLWQEHSAIDTRKPIRSLVFVIAHNRSLDYLRKKKVRSGGTPGKEEGMADDHEMREMLMSAIDGMPEERKMVLVMSKSNELSSQEISRRLGLPLKTVNRELELAMNELHRNLKM